MIHEIRMRFVDWTFTLVPQWVHLPLSAVWVAALSVVALIIVGACFAWPRFMVVALPLSVVLSIFI